jgi:hypothetical protein
MIGRWARPIGLVLVAALLWPTASAFAASETATPSGLSLEQAYQQVCGRPGLAAEYARGCARVRPMLRSATIARSKPSCVSLGSDRRKPCALNLPIGPPIVYGQTLNLGMLNRGLKAQGIGRLDRLRVLGELRNESKPKIYDQVKQARSDKWKAAAATCLVMGAIGIVLAAIAALITWSFKPLSFVAGGAVGCVGAALQGPGAELAKRISTRWKLRA